MTDHRTCSLQAAVSFAESEGLLGIVPNSEMLFVDKKGKPTKKKEEMIGGQAVVRCHQKKIICWTWGDMNTYPELVELQRKWEVDGIICDNVAMLSRKDKHGESIFHKEFSDQLHSYSAAAANRVGSEGGFVWPGSNTNTEGDGKDHLLMTINEEEASAGGPAGKKRVVAFTAALFVLGGLVAFGATLSRRRLL